MGLLFGSPPTRTIAAGPSIGIVGAGPAGLSLARILTDRGFRDVTVLERSERVGGKSLTIQHEGVGHEVGTCYFTEGYTQVRAWMRRYGMTSHRLRRHVIHRVDGTTTDFGHFVSGGSRARMCDELWRYGQHWLRFFTMQELGRDRATFDAEVSVPFGEWLRERNFPGIERFALRSMTAMGYGHLDQVPALYGLRWNTPSLLLSAAAMHIDEPVPGWSHLWQSMAATLDVRLGWDTAHVDRGPRGVEVIAKDGQRLRFDHLVVSTPPDECGAWLPLADDERAVFGRLRWDQFATTLVVADGWFRHEDTHSFEASLRGADGPLLGNILVARRTADKTPVAEARTDARKPVYVVYQYGNRQLSDTSLRERVTRDIARQGGKVAQVLGQFRWKHSPKLPREAIAAGAVWDMEALQGKRRTWYTGASLSHESVNNVVDYNVKLADRMEHALHGYAEQTLGKWWWQERKAAERLVTWHNK
ncbi:MAG: FAD-dependent oxidoreductase [Pseudomonadota bacterium]|nr:FAD-dependent oxidoreductase [Pseudomonadota bacterium]